MKKISINMLSKADSVEGQGVGSAYLEQVGLLKEKASHVYDITINSRKKADIVHVHSINFPYFFRMKKNIKGSVVYVHFLPETLLGSIKLPKPIFAIFKRYVIRFYKKADYLVVVNPIFIKELEKYKIPKERITYIPNYVSKEKFNELDSNTILQTKKKLKIDEKKFIVLGCGQLQIRKGIFDFIEIAKNNEDILFVWCGGFSFGKITDGYEEIKKIYDNPPANVRFLGIIPREDMNEMFNMANVLFMPSFNELFPMSILEAANAKKPILLRDLELYEDILFDKYLKANNNDDFTKIINQLKDDKEFYNQYSNKASDIATFYSAENVSKLWIEFYNKIYDQKQTK